MAKIYLLNRCLVWAVYHYIDNTENSCRPKTMSEFSSSQNGYFRKTTTLSLIGLVFY